MRAEERYCRWITQRWYESLQLQLRAAREVGDIQQAEAIAERCGHAVVVSQDEVMPGRVQFGSFVTVFAIEEQEERSFQIVSADEADIGRELLGATSPLARALYGAQEGDEVTTVTKSGSACDYEVTHIGVAHPPVSDK